MNHYPEDLTRIVRKAFDDYNPNIRTKNVLYPKYESTVIKLVFLIFQNYAENEPTFHVNGYSVRAFADIAADILPYTIERVMTPDEPITRMQRNQFMSRYRHAYAIQLTMCGTDRISVECWSDNGKGKPIGINSYHGRMNGETEFFKMRREGDFMDVLLSMPYVPDVMRFERGNRAFENVWNYFAFLIGEGDNIGKHETISVTEWYVKPVFKIIKDNPVIIAGSKDNAKRGCKRLFAKRDAVRLACYLTDMEYYENLTKNIL